MTTTPPGPAAARPWPAGLTITGDPSTLRLSSREEHLAAVPYLLGYVPHESLLLLGQTDGDGGRLHPSVSARHDLPPLDDDGRADPRLEQDLARVAAEALARGGAEAVVVAVWTRRAVAPDGAPPWASTATAYAQACRDAGVRVVDVLVQAAGTVHSLWCDDPVCCPPEGHPLPDTTTSPALRALADAVGEPAVDRGALAARFVGTGAQLLRSRVALARTAQTLDRLDEDGLDRRVAHVPGLLDGLVRRRLTGAAAVLDDDDLALVALALAVDLRVRDEAVRRVVRRPPAREALLEVLVDAARRLDDDADAPVLGAVALLAYCCGDGTLADVASRRALDHLPGHSLSRLVQDCLDRALPPGDLVGVWATSEEVVPGGASGRPGRPGRAGRARGPGRATRRSRVRRR